MQPQLGHWRSLFGSLLLAGAFAGCGRQPSPSADISDAAADNPSEPAADRPMKKLLITLPVGATDVEQSPKRIKFKLPGGSADEAVRNWRDEFVKQGWDIGSAQGDDLTGTMVFVRAGAQLVLTYADTKFIPAELVLEATGIELDVAGEPADQR
jgi:hypothetical protein